MENKKEKLEKSVAEAIAKKEEEKLQKQIAKVEQPKEHVSIEDWNQIQLLEKDLINANLQVELIKTKVELAKHQLIIKYDIKPNDKVEQTREIIRASIQSLHSESSIQSV